MAKLRIENLSKCYAGNAVVDRVSFDVAEGEFCILLGPSGCGKSTILRLIAGLVRQDEGAIFIGDADVSSLPPPGSGCGHGLPELCPLSPSERL